MQGSHTGFASAHSQRSSLSSFASAALYGVAIDPARASLTAASLAPDGRNGALPRRACASGCGASGCGASGCGASSCAGVISSRLRISSKRLRTHSRKEHGMHTECSWRVLGGSPPAPPRGGRTREPCLKRSSVILESPPSRGGTAPRELLARGRLHWGHCGLERRERNISNKPPGHTGGREPTNQPTNKQYKTQHTDNTQNNKHANIQFDVIVFMSVLFGFVSQPLR